MVTRSITHPKLNIHQKLLPGIIAWYTSASTFLGAIQQAGENDTKRDSSSCSTSSTSSSSSSSSCSTSSPRTSVHCELSQKRYIRKRRINIAVNNNGYRDDGEEANAQRWLPFVLVPFLMRHLFTHSQRPPATLSTQKIVIRQATRCRLLVVSEVVGVLRAQSSNQQLELQESKRQSSFFRAPSLALTLYFTVLDLRKSRRKLGIESRAILQNQIFAGFPSSSAFITQLLMDGWWRR